MHARTDPNGPGRLDWIVPCFPPTASLRALAPSRPRAHRRACNDALEHAVRQARRYGTQSSVALMDVDHFTNVNDAFGHVAGDEALRGFAACAAHTLRRSDALFRTGGEAFTVALPNTATSAATDMIERIRQTIEETAMPLTDDHEVRRTTSIGVAQRSDEVSQSHDLLRAADEAMTEAKTAGRNDIRVARPALAS